MQVPKQRIEQLTAEERKRFSDRTKASFSLAKRAVEPLPAAVPSGVAALSPYPLALESGSGAEVRDVDGNNYVDYWNGFGTSVFGHAHPEITTAIKRRAELGTHFGALTESAYEWAEHLRGRMRLDWVRFNSSGTEATMDAMRLAIARTGRDRIAKIEGGYHGAHPQALISTNLELGDDAGPDPEPRSRPFGSGIPQAVVESVSALPFNDLEAAERLLTGERHAALIIEPILCNVGMIFPVQGYLEGLREICDRTGTLLIFDEVKTAISIAYGGAEELFGVRPDLKTMGKGIGGGIGCGAIGGAEEWGYEMIASWEVPQLSTFAGNPLAASAGVAALRSVLKPPAYRGLEQHRRQLSEGIERVISDYELDAYVVGAGSKGCLVWSAERLSDYRDYRRSFDFSLAYLVWLGLVNRGVLLAPGQDEQWTHSVAHGPEHAGRFADALEDICKRLRR